MNVRMLWKRDGHPPHTFNYEMSRREIYRGDNVVAPQSKLTL